MTLFQVVRLVLDKLYKQATATHGENVDDVIRKRMDYLAKNYANLADPDRGEIDYRDPAVRFAYVYMYVAAHGDYIVQVWSTSELSRRGLFSQRNRSRCLAWVAAPVVTCSRSTSTSARTTDLSRWKGSGATL